MEHVETENVATIIETRLSEYLEAGSKVYVLREVGTLYVRLFAIHLKHHGQYECEGASASLVDITNLVGALLTMAIMTVGENGSFVLAEEREALTEDGRIDALICDISYRLFQGQESNLTGVLLN